MSFKRIKPTLNMNELSTTMQSVTHGGDMTINSNSSTPN